MNKETVSYLSVCSGIEAVSVACEPLGWTPVAFAEIEKFPSAVLAHRWPHVPNLGDMTKIKGADFHGRIDVLVGGTPCQSFSVAGLRRGLDDERGNLALEFVRLADECNPAFIVWENVPGILSDRGNAFGCFLAALAGEEASLLPPGKRWTNAGYVLGSRRTIAWVVKDAQYFGLAQRRRRVFLVACSRNGADPRKVLFEYEGLRRDTPPSKETETDVAGTLESSFARSRGAGTSPGAIVAFGGGNCQSEIAKAAPLNAHGRRQDFDTETVCVVARPLRAQSQSAHDDSLESYVTHTLRREGFDASEDGTDLISGTLGVRRLTPREWERLQGFPDDYTLIPWRKKPASECPDGPRYKALGNSMAVPVMHWIFRRIEAALTLH